MFRNRFEQAHFQGRGEASEKSVRALDAYLGEMGSDAFNVYRAKVGIKPNTPNRRLSRRQAWLLRQEIEKAKGAGDEL